MKLDDIYRDHPLSKRTILARVAAQGIAVPRITEWHLAIDPDTEITDQNHTGGVQATLELAAAAHVDRDSTVIDVGSGLGGPARVVAQACGCRVVGIERDAGRYEDAVALTDIVGLGERVTFRKQDALTDAPQVRDADVLWGQATWIHFPDPGAFLDRWLPVLKPLGAVAMADSHLKREPASGQETTLIEDLENAWGARLLSIERWRRELEARGGTIVHCQERTDEALASFRRLADVADAWPTGTVTDAERDSWRHALSAYASGLIGAFRLVARLR